MLLIIEILMELIIAARGIFEQFCSKMPFYLTCFFRFDFNIIHLKMNKIQAEKREERI